MEKNQQQLLESMPDGMVVVDAGGRIEFVSRQALKMSGYARQELIGRKIEMLVPTAKRAAHRGNRTSYAAKPLPRAMGSGLNISFRRKDGSEFPADIALSPFRASDGLKIIAAVRDITERKRAHDRVEAMLEMTRATLDGRSSEQILSLLIRRARRMIDASQGLALVPGADPKTMTVRIADGLNSRRLAGKSYPVDSPAARAGPTILAPLEAADHSFGAVAISNPGGGRPFSAEDVATVQLFATQAAAALEYSRLRGELQRLAVVEDRERIARELHDGAIQSLFAVGMGLQGLASREADSELQQRIEAAVVQIDRVIRDLRNYIFGLRPGILGDGQLHQALTRIAEDFQKRTGVATVIDIDPHVAARLSGQAGDLIQLATEVLSNVSRHADATTCRVSLHRNQSDGVLEIDDDGKGFDTSRPPGRGQGLRNLRERADRLGGRLAISSSAGRGTSVRVAIRL